MRTVLITGASKGIGLAATERFAKEGYKVFATVRHPEQAEALQRLAQQFPENIFIEQLDVTDTEENIFAYIKTIGDIDILINNAGIGLFGPAETATEQETRNIFEVNYFGVRKITNAVLPGMRERNSGKIITISSIVGPLPDPYLPDYSASKAAVESLMAVYRKDLIDAGFNIVVANVQPGPVLTEFEGATTLGKRFEKSHNPYQQTTGNEEKWRSIMRNGRPVEETVQTIMRVVNDPHPNYWNPTERAVEEQFTRVYQDISGNTYMAGISIPSKTELEIDSKSARALAEQQQYSKILRPQSTADSTFQEIPHLP